MFADKDKERRLIQNGDSQVQALEDRTVFLHILVFGRM